MFALARTFTTVWWANGRTCLAHCFSSSTTPLALGTYFLPVSNWPYRSTAVSFTTMPFLFMKLGGGGKWREKERMQEREPQYGRGGSRVDFSRPLLVVGKLRVSLLPYCSVSPWTSFTQSFCSLSDRWVTLVGGGVVGLSYTLWTPGGSSRQNLPARMK